jgi:hypothetical protein
LKEKDNDMMKYHHSFLVYTSFLQLALGFQTCSTLNGPQGPSSASFSSFHTTYYYNCILPNALLHSKSKYHHHQEEEETTKLNPKRNSNIKKKQVRSWERSVSTITGQWREQYEALKAYSDTFGHCRVPYNYAPNPKLARWVARQRTIYRKMQKNGNETITNIRRSNVLTSERIEALEKIGFSFEVPRRQSWNTRFDQLCLYRAVYGDCLVPIQYEEVPGLAPWVRNQRSQYRNLLKGKPEKCSLTPERIEALMSIGFVWDTQRRDLWKQRFDELCDFKAVYGHCRVPINYHENRQLGAWVANQRISYKNFMAGMTGGNEHYDEWKDEEIQNAFQWKANGGVGLTKDKIAALNSIGFVWDQSTFNWYTMYERLKRYKEERRLLLQHSDDSVKSDGSIESSKLFFIPPEDVANRDLRIWISFQRKEHATYLLNKERGDQQIVSVDPERNGVKPCTMTARRKRALDAIGFIWKVHEQKEKDTTDGPSVDDWTKLFEQMRQKGIDKNAELTLVDKQDQIDIDKEWNEDDLLELWNMEDEE